MLLTNHQEPDLHRELDNQISQLLSLTEQLEIDRSLLSSMGLKGMSRAVELEIKNNKAEMSRLLEAKSLLNKGGPLSQAIDLLLNIH